MNFEHLMKGPFYAPPYESPLEDLFAFTAIKYLDSSVHFQKQIEVETICGKFRLDFMAFYGENKIAFECDGQEYHDKSRDEWRDAMILGTNLVDVIYRLRGRDLTYHLEDCLFVISQFNPEIFSQRGLVNLDKLATDESHGYKLENDEENIMITYWKQSKGIDPLYIFIQRRFRQIPPDKRYFWKHLFDYAIEHSGSNLDELMLKYRKERGLIKKDETDVG